MEEEIFTEAHHKARSEALAILDKYFDGYILVLTVASEDTKYTATEFSFSGSVDAAIGMAERMKYRLLQNLTPS